VTEAPDAGVSTTLNACASDATVGVFTALGPNADAGGSWTDLDGAGAAFNNGTLDATQVGVSTYRFVYDVAGLGPCSGDQDTVSVIINAGLDPGIGGAVTVCGGEIDLNLFSVLGGEPDRGGVWNDPLGTGALYSDSLLNASLLSPGGPYQFGYTLLDPGCGETSSVVEITITSYPDPGADSSVAVCITSAAFDLFQMIGGDPDAGGTWTDPSGINVTATFTPGISQAGTYRYHLNGNAPCADTSAAVVVTVNQPANAGADGSLQRCNLGTLDLSTVLSGTAQPGGAWTDVDGGGGLSGNVLTLDQLSVGQYRYDYTVVVPGCGTDQSRLTLTVVEGVEVSDTVITCNEQDRTYTVQFTLSGGDPTTYAVTGLTGTISEQAPYVFTSTPIYTSQSFSLTADDANHCAPRVIEGGTPCVFSDDVFVPESFTPNGDGLNDLFVIPGIEGFPQNSIHIFNRWGAEMFSASGYDNKGVVWNGSSPDALLPGDAPTGTYYYVIDLGNDSEALRGFIYLNR
jgi:gliding motility-associated-like protein